MSGGTSPGDVSPAARALARERLLATLEEGRDAYIEEPDPAQQLACARHPLSQDPRRMAAVVVPDMDGALCMAARTGQRGPGVALVPPDMPEAGRRDLGFALRNHAVQLILVTPDRLSQPKFVQFIRSQNPVYVGVAACERLYSDGPDYFPPFESLRALRALFPAVPLLALASGPQSDAVRRAIATALGLKADLPAVSSAPPSAPPTKTAAPTPSDTAAAPPTASATNVPPHPRAVPESLRAAFDLFEHNRPVTEVAEEIDQDETWVLRALDRFIRHTGRTNPFPWVDKPTYLAVSMVAGQAESTDPRLIRSLMKGAVDEGQLALVLAALDNRKPKG